MIGKWSKRNPGGWTDYVEHECAKCVKFYDLVIQETRFAIYTWSLYAKQIGICKDVTQMISHFIWKLKSKDI